jgi:hypothetical protein
MARIAVLLAQDFEDSELRKPLDALRDAGHEVTLLGEAAGDTVKGKRGREEVVLDDAVEGTAPRNSAPPCSSASAANRGPGSLETRPPPNAAPRRRDALGRPAASHRNQRGDPPCVTTSSI